MTAQALRKDSDNVAPLPTIPNVIRCAFKGRTGPGTTWVNVMHVEKDPGTSYTAAILAVEGVFNEFWSSAGFGGGVTGWAAHAGSGARYDESTYTPLDGVSASQKFTHAVSGTGTGDNLPPDTAVCLTWRTGKRGPRYRGRNYLGGFVESASDSVGRLVAGFVTSLDALGTGLIGELTGVNAPLVIASYKYATAEEVLFCDVDNVFDRQRRRRT